MKYMNNLKNKVQWEQYYDPSFNWNDIEFYQDNKLSDDFIREFQDKVDWNFISKYQKLSENFIREFQDKVDWYYIAMNQKLSKKFIREFQINTKILFEYYRYRFTF